MSYNFTEHYIERAFNNNFSLRNFGPFFPIMHAFQGEGNSSGKHFHQVPHVSFIAYGAVKFILYNEDETIQSEKIIHAPDFIEVPAKLKHELIAVTHEVMWICMFMMLDPNGKWLHEEVKINRNEVLKWFIPDAS